CGGLQGRMVVVSCVAAPVNAVTENPEETTRVHEWRGTAEGQRPLGETGAAFPAALDAQDAFTEYWAEKGIDTTAFAKAAGGETTPAPVGSRSNAGLESIGTVLPEMFEGRIPVEQALEQAEQAANEAIAD